MSIREGEAGREVGGCRPGGEWGWMGWGVGGGEGVCNDKSSACVRVHVSVCLCRWMRFQFELIKEKQVIQVSQSLSFW